MCPDDISVEENVWRMTDLVVDHVKYTVAMSMFWALDIVHEEDVPVFSLF